MDVIKGLFDLNICVACYNLLITCVRILESVLKSSILCTNLMPTILAGSISWVNYITLANLFSPSDPSDSVIEKQNNPLHKLVAEDE